MPLVIGHFKGNRKVLHCQGSFTGWGSCSKKKDMPRFTFLNIFAWEAHFFLSGKYYNATDDENKKI